MKKVVGIYKITSPSGKIYIGQSWDILGRFNRYNCNHVNKQRHLYHSFEKHGKENHLFEIIHELPFDVTQDILDRYEQVYMDAYRDAGVELLNIREGGSRGKNSEESKRRLVETRRKNGSYFHTEETKKNIGNTVRDKNLIKYVQTEQARQRAVESRVGSHHSEDHKNNISKALIGKKKSETHVEKFRGEKNKSSKLTEQNIIQIRQKYSNGNPLSELSIEYNVTPENISSIVKRQTWKHI